MRAGICVTVRDTARAVLSDALLIDREVLAAAPTTARPTAVTVPTAAPATIEAALNAKHPDKLPAATITQEMVKARLRVTWCANLTESKHRWPRARRTRKRLPSHAP